MSLTARPWPPRRPTARGRPLPQPRLATTATPWRAGPPPPPAVPPNSTPSTSYTTRLAQAPDGRVNFAGEEEDGGSGQALRSWGASLSSSSGSDEDGSSSDDDAPPPSPPFSPSSAEAEALSQLEWPAVCRQVACLARTVRGARAALAGGLALGATRDASAAALETTAEAVRVAAAVPGYWDVLASVVDIGGLLDDLERGGGGDEAEVDTEGGDQPPPGLLVVASPAGVLATADTLDAAAGLEAGLASAPGGPSAHPRLSALVAGCECAALASLRSSLRAAMPAGKGARLSDAACPALAAARAARTAAEGAVRTAAGEWARRLHAAGAAERPAVAVRRERLCVPVLAARRGGHLPKGSVRLAESGSGATLYMEPAPLVPLNNAAAAARAAVEAAEAALLQRLSALIARHAPALRACLEALEALDLAAARAAHAGWAGGVRPALLSREEARRRGAARLDGLLHPLLLEGALPPLPDPPGATEAGSPAEPPPPRRPRPRGVAWSVPPGTGVVTITGPNTGGKTAALKSLGLAALMARAGLFLPVEPRETREDAAIAWFCPVLADVGDAQSLEASLSTFSGSVARAGRALAAAGPDALALVDEVGSGTDPAEGAALAGALLDALASRAALTVATTHHASLKGDARPGRADAAVEFDAARLAPTYRLVWGSAGASSALDVAEGLGYDKVLVGAARVALASAGGRGDSLGGGGGVAAAAADAVEAARTTGRPPTVAPPPASPADIRAALEAGAAAELEAARAAAAAAAADRAAAEAEAAAAQAALAALQRRAGGDVSKPPTPAAKDAGRAAAAAAAADLAWVLDAHARGELSDDDAAACVADIRSRAPDARAAAARLAGAALAGTAGMSSTAPPTPPSMDWAPAVGDTVAVLKMGGVPGTVLKVSAGGRLSVRVGRTTLALGPGEAAPAVRGGGGKDGGARRPSQPPPPTAAAAPSKPGPAVQTSANTLDVRGARAAQAASLVADFLGRTGDEGDALFIIHGLGPLKKAVREALQGAGGVASVGDPPGGEGGGVTMVRVGER